MIRPAAGSEQQPSECWQLPRRDEGFWRSFHALYRTGVGPERWLQGLPKELARLEEAGLIESLPAEDRRRPYRLTGLGATTLETQLRGLSAFAEHGLRRLGGAR